MERGLDVDLREVSGREGARASLVMPAQHGTATRPGERHPRAVDVQEDGTDCVELRLPAAGGPEGETAVNLPQVVARR